MSKCKKHPKYQAIYRPKCDCVQCWLMWKKRNVENSRKPFIK